MKPVNLRTAETTLSSFVVSASQDTASETKQIAHLTKEKLQNVARILSVTATANTPLEEKCFQAAFTACQKKEWNKIDPIREDLSFLVNTIGHTLLIEAALGDDVNLTQALLARNITLCSVGQLDSSVAISLDRMGTALSKRSCHEEAFEYKRQALGMKRKLYGLRPHSDVAQSLYSLGITLGDLGRDQEAVQCLEDSLSMRHTLCVGQPHPDVVQSLMDLAKVLDKLGHHQKFLAYNKEALFLLMAIYNEKFPVLSQAFLSHCQREYNFDPLVIMYPEKKVVTSKSLKVKKPGSAAQKHGNRDREGKAYGNLAIDYFHLGEYRKAIKYYEKELAIAQKHRDREGEGGAYGNLGIAYKSLGEYRKAIEFHEKHLSIAQELGDRGGEGSAYGNLGNAYRSLGKYRKAIEYHEKHLSITQELGNRKGKGCAYGNLGNAYDSLGEYRKAIESHEKRLSIAQELGDRGGEGSAYGNLGNAYQSLGKYHKSIEYHEKDLSIAQELGDRGGEGSAYGNLGIAYDSLGKHRKAIEYHEKDLSIAQELGERGGEERAYTNLGIAYLSLEEHRKAIEYYEKSLSITQKLGDRGGRGSAYSGLGIAYRSLGKYRKAIEYHEKHLSITQELGDRRGERRAYTNLGNTYHLLGEYRKAIEYHEKSLSIAQELGDRRGEGNTYTNLGNTYLLLGEYRKAIEFHEKSLSITQELRKRGGEGTVYGNLGNAYNSLGEYRKAIEFHEKSLSIAQELGDRRGKGLTYVSLGNAYNSLGNYWKAIEYHKKSLSIAQKLGTREWKGIAYGGLGMAYDYLGNYRKAIEFHEKSLSIAQKLGNRGGEGNAYNNLGVTYKDLKNFQKAEKHLNKTIQVYSTLQKELGDSNQWKITIFEKQAKAYASLEEVLLMQKKQEQALEATDFRRSRVLVDILLKKHSSQSNESLSHTSLTCEQIQQLARDQDTTLVIYSLASLLFEKEKRIEVWIVPPQGNIIWESLPVDAIQEDLEGLSRFPFNKQGSVVTRSPEIPFLNDMVEMCRDEDKEKKNPTDIAAQKLRLKIFKKRLASWYNVFIAPIEKYLPQNPQQKMTIIPDDFLSQMPFAAFRDSEGKYLIEKHTISIAPSIKTLQLLEQNKRSMNFAQTPMIVGNPTTNNPTDILKFSEREAKQVGTILEAEPEQVLIQDKAKVNHVIQGMQNARWIHLACHGQPGRKPKFEPHSVFEGMLQLSPDEEHPEGHLHAQKIAGLDLKADLVFMSACYSGTGKLQREGSIGHVWSFLASGTLSTIATYWPLPDSELTVQMVTEFYRHILGKSPLAVEKERSLGKAEALREVMLMAIEKERERPDLWGSFFLSGLA